MHATAIDALGPPVRRRPLDYQIWMSFVNDYKNAGGRVAVGDDAGQPASAVCASRFMTALCTTRRRFWPMRSECARTRKHASRGRVL